VNLNAHALARYAALCQEAGLLPLVEQDVVVDGPHPIERCADVTSAVLDAVFRALAEQRVALTSILLQPSVVIAGRHCPRPARADEVAAVTLRCLRRHVPDTVPGIVFALSDHQDAITRLPVPTPWKIGFSYGLHDPVLGSWRSRRARLPRIHGVMVEHVRADTHDGDSAQRPADAVVPSGSGISTVAHVPSGSNVRIARARPRVEGPRSFWKTMPS
jgi:fructose-bisphosphate aldolase class I